MPTQGSCGGAWFSTAGGIGLRCPNCGAENAEATLYCGSCAAQLREFTPVERGNVVSEEPPPKLDRSVRRRFSKPWAIIVLIMGALQLAGIIAGGATIAESVFGVAFVVAGTAMIILSWRQKSRGGMDALWRPMSVGTPPAPEEVVASVRSISLAGMAMLSGFAVTGPVFLVMAAFMYDGGSDWEWIIPATIGGVMLAFSLVIGMVRSDLLLSRDGISFQAARVGVTVSFGRLELSVLELNGRVLRVGLSNPPFGVSRQSRYIILGNAEERERLAQAVAAYGLQGPWRS